MENKEKPNLKDDEKKDLAPESGEIIEEAESLIEIVEIKDENEPMLDDSITSEPLIGAAGGDDQAKKIRSKRVYAAVIGILILAIISLGVIDYSKISGFLQKKVNPYGFDYNFNKIRSFDWDTMITEKKVAKALGVPIEKINSAKNPDYSWVLEDPNQFVNQVKCASLIDEKILDEGNADGSKNLFNINVMLCDNTKETNDTYNSREDEIKNIESTDPTIKLQSLEDIKNIGTKAYVYSIEKAATAADPNNPDASQSSPAQKFAGIVLLRGPFVVMIDESEQPGLAVISSPDVRNKLASYLDSQLKQLLTWY